MADGVVDQRGPEQGEHAPRAELHSFCDGPDYECRRDDREHHLVDGKQELRHAIRGRFDRVATGHQSLVCIGAVDAEFGKRLHEHEARVPAQVTVGGQRVTGGILARVHGDGRRHSEGHAVAIGHPLQGDQRHAHHHEHEHVEKVLGPNHAAVKEGEARHHQEYKRCTHEHPGDRPGVVRARDVRRSRGRSRGFALREGEGGVINRTEEHCGQHGRDGAEARRARESHGFRLMIFG